MYIASVTDNTNGIKSKLNHKEQGQTDKYKV